MEFIIPAIYAAIVYTIAKIIYDTETKWKL